MRINVRNEKSEFRKGVTILIYCAYNGQLHLQPIDFEVWKDSIQLIFLKALDFYSSHFLIVECPLLFYRKPIKKHSYKK